MKNITAVFIIFMCLSFFGFGQNRKSFKQTDIMHGQLWPDNSGTHINAHSGGILFFNGVYYWHGNIKFRAGLKNNTADGGISCYSSTDLVNWNNAGVVLKVDYANEKSDIAYGCILERPKVVFNEETRKFIAYLKLFLRGEGYATAYVGVATANSPLGHLPTVINFLPVAL